MSKKIIIPTGYMGSGSSAVTDILREYDNLNTKNADFEYIFLHMPGGLFDLEDKLLINNNALRSDEAIKSFRSSMQDLYSLRGWWPGNYKKYVSKNFLIILEKYIEKLKTGQFTGVWYYNEKYKGYKLYKRAIKNRILRLLGKPDSVDKFNIEYSFINEKDFYNYSCEFISDFVNELNIDEKQYVLLDQLVLPHNIYRLTKYNSIEMFPIVVERDPRDVFIMNKYIWNPAETPVLYPLDVKEFCIQYKAMRENEKNCNDKMLCIKFEDLVFNYEKSIKKIESYLGLQKENHINVKKYFNPEISKRNIQIYKQEKYKEEVAIIEKELEKYLYITDKVVLSNENPF